MRPVTERTYRRVLKLTTNAHTWDPDTVERAYDMARGDAEAELEKMGVSNRTGFTFSIRHNVNGGGQTHVLCSCYIYREQLGLL